MIFISAHRKSNYELKGKCEQFSGLRKGFPETQKGELGRKDQGKRGRNKKKVWVRLVKKELHKHVDLVSGYQTPAPSGTSVGMAFLEDRGTGSQMVFIIIYSE